MPESPAAGLTLPQAVLLLQPVLRCWADRCRTCNQYIDLNQLELFTSREYQSPTRSRQSVASKMKAGTNLRTISRRIELPFGLTVSGAYSS
jgi:hypothetical protein